VLPDLRINVILEVEDVPVDISLDELGEAMPFVFGGRGEGRRGRERLAEDAI
jgi:predicted Zn-dependent protease with MMP-like domain